MKYPKVRITIALVLTMLALGASTGEPETLMNDGTIVIQGGTALVGPDLRPLEDAVVVIRDGVIATIGSATDVEVPGGAEVIDATGLTLVPGLIDAHVHISFASPAEVLRGGVTTVRDLGWPPEKIWPLVEASEDPDFDGPRIVAAGQMLTVDGGYPMAAGWAPPGTGLVVSSPGDAAAAVAAQADAGAVVIKVALNSAVGPAAPDHRSRGRPRPPPRDSPGAAAPSTPGSGGPPVTPGRARTAHRPGARSGQRSAGNLGNVQPGA